MCRDTITWHLKDPEPSTFGNWQKCTHLYKVFHVCSDDCRRKWEAVNFCDRCDERAIYRVAFTTGTTVLCELHTMRRYQMSKDIGAAFKAEPLGELQ